MAGLRSCCAGALALLTGFRGLLAPALLACAPFAPAACEQAPALDAEQLQQGWAVLQTVCACVLWQAGRQAGHAHKLARTPCPVQVMWAQALAAQLP